MYEEMLNEFISTVSPASFENALQFFTSTYNESDYPVDPESNR